MKAKSVKLRMLITLEALFKHSDKNHRISSTKLNEYLRPYGLECTRRVLADTIAAMRDFGLDVRCMGTWDQRGAWLESRPISDATLRQLVFAVSTNPYLSEDQARESLDALKPFLTVYQEAMLNCKVENRNHFAIRENVFRAYTTACEALDLNRRIIYTVNQIGYDRKTGEVYSREQWKTLFTPKCLYQDGQEIYMVGYNHPDKHIEAVKLSDVVNVRIATKHSDPNGEIIQELLRDVDPRDHIPNGHRASIYRGPVIFKCRGQHLKELVDRYGMPDEPVKKNKAGHTTFILHDVEIGADTLIWLSQIPRHGIRIKGPQELIDAVSSHNAKVINTLLSPRLDKEM